jgi:hypothetical protein
MKNASNLPAISMLMPQDEYGSMHIAQWSASMASHEALYATTGQVLLNKGASVVLLFLEHTKCVPTDIS